MNGKIQKVEAEIEKVKAKITAQQARLRELERQGWRFACCFIRRKGGFGR